LNQKPQHSIDVKSTHQRSATAHETGHTLSPRKAYMVQCMATAMVPWTVATNDIAFNAPWCLAHDPTTFVANGTASNCCQTKTSLNRNAIERPKILSATQTSTSLPSCTIGF